MTLARDGIMARGLSQPGQVHLRIIEVMKRFPEGISGGRIRSELEKEGLAPSDLRNLHRRINELNKWFIIDKIVVEQTGPGGLPVVSDEWEITPELRAEVLYQARGHCQKCGRTIKTDGVTLVITRKRPMSLSAAIGRENLWAICEHCYRRKNLYSRPPHPGQVGARPKFNYCRASIAERERQYEL